MGAPLGAERARDGSATSAREPRLDVLAARERARDRRRARDLMGQERLRWRAHAVRHLAHLLPGQRVLELGCGEGAFAPLLREVTRGEVAITQVRFGGPGDRDRGVLAVDALPGPLTGRRFDAVVVGDLLDRATCAWLLRQARDLLAPGGHLVAWTRNPASALRAIAGLGGAASPGRLALTELLSALGFVRAQAVPHDFVTGPDLPGLSWAQRNLAVLLEAAPGIRSQALDLLVHAELPPPARRRPRPSLAEHTALFRSVSVVVPCHDEEENVAPLVDGLRELYGDYLHEVVLVDDASRDGTRQVLEGLAAQDPRVRPVFRRPPCGVGRALADGYRAATGRWVLSIDCDFQHLLPELRDLFDAAAAGCDAAIGSRFSRHSLLLGYPFLKVVANRGFHLLARMLLRRPLRDTTNNCKLVRRDVLERIAVRHTGFAANAETGLLPVALGLSVEEVPVSWVDRDPDMGSSSFRILRVGGGYWRVLADVALGRWLGKGPYGWLARPRAVEAEAPARPPGLDRLRSLRARSEAPTERVTVAPRRQG